MSGSANIPLAGGGSSPVVANPSYVPPPTTAANDTDNNNNNNYQMVNGNDNIVVGKAVNTTVAQVGRFTHLDKEAWQSPAMHVGPRNDLIPLLARICQQHAQPLLSADNLTRLSMQNEL